MSIQRYEMTHIECSRAHFGDLVYYDDHKREVDALHAEILRLKSLLNKEYDGK